MIGYTVFIIHALVFSLSIQRWQAGSFTVSFSDLMAPGYCDSMFVISLHFCIFIFKEIAAQMIHNVH